MAKGEADAILLKYEAEAEGIRKVLESKAEGYRQLVEHVGEDKKLAPTLLLVEKLPELVEQQVKAIQNLKIDKITVWDSGNGDKNGSGTSTSNFLKGFIGSLPPIHDLAKQVGVELPEYLGELTDDQKTIASSKVNKKPPPPAPMA